MELWDRVVISTEAGQLYVLRSGKTCSSAGTTSSPTGAAHTRARTLEATDPTGQLFGFDRVLQHLHQNLSPSALADAAQLFGQEADISLISLTLNPLPA